MTEIINVTKRDGSLEPIDLDKIHQVINWAAEGLNVSVSEVELKAHIQFYDGIKTSDIHDMLVKSAADLITEWQADYSLMAARLCMFGLRKKAFGQFKPRMLYDQIKTMTDRGIYDKHILEDYSIEDIAELSCHINHDRDLDFHYAAVKQLEGKYLCQNRVTGEIYESPQQLYMLVAMCLFAGYPTEARMQYVKDFYDATSLGKLSLPTPIMAGVRTPTRQFSSCTLIESGDSLNSINATSAAIVKYVSQRAGIGVNAGAIRALGSPIRNGEAFHTGCIPFYKHFQTAVKSCSQGGVRGGAATLFYPLWHLEVESLLVLKNNRGTEENRVRHMDYGVQLNRLMYQRLIKGENITLFSPHDVPGLYNSFFADQDEFERLYMAAEADDSIRKRTVKASELFATLMAERAGTGRIYIQNVDHCNTHSPFDPQVAPVKQSNLCVAPETQILTDHGYIPIAELEGETANIWNGEEWSEVLVSKTGENQKLLRVTTSSGEELECTPYHKFYVFNGYGKPYIEKRAHELENGDKLAKFDLPVVEGSKVLENAYINGFYSGDGCFTKSGQRVYLYHDKRKLEHLFDGGSDWIVQDGFNRQYKHYSNLKDKFFVPSSDYDIQSRLDWMAGWLDSDGCVYRNGTNEAIVASSIEREFLREVQLMLQTLGVSAKLNKNADAGYRLLPANDGTGELKEFWCQESWRLCVTSNDSYKLLCMGLNLHRLDIKKRKPQRDAKQFNKVVSVIDEGRVDDTYCFNEPKRHMGMFNGILTGQCLEIALPTKPLTDINDPNGEIALCTLSAFNLGAIESTEELEHLSDLIVRALDALLDYQDYPVKAAKISAKARRTLGVGVTNFAYFLAKNGVRYSDGSANQLVHKWFEAIQYYLIKASAMLAQEQGPCEWFNQTKYAKGQMPIDHYKSTVDELAAPEYAQDWDALRDLVAKHGLRNSTLTALMPCETSSQITNSTNGIEPPRGYVSVKLSKDGVLKQVVPDFAEIFDKYELLWDIPSNEGYMQLVAIMQKFVDQSISANTNYDPKRFEGGRVPMKQMLRDLLTAYKYGVKTLYYQNTRDGQGSEEDGGCDGGGCKL